jgi:hypothetical protein
MFEVASMSMEDAERQADALIKDLKTIILVMSQKFTVLILK